MLRFYKFLEGYNPCPCKTWEYDNYETEGLNAFGITKEEGREVCRIMDMAEICLYEVSWGGGLCRTMTKDNATKLVKSIINKKKEGIRESLETRIIRDSYILKKYYRLLNILGL